MIEWILLFVIIIVGISVYAYVSSKKQSQNQPKQKLISIFNNFIDNARGGYINPATVGSGIKGFCPNICKGSPGSHITVCNPYCRNCVFGGGKWDFNTQQCS